jgi:hypothetical protein
VPISNAQLNYILGTLRLVTEALEPVQPGQLVQANILSTLTEVSGVDIGTLAVPLPRPIELGVSWRVFDHERNERYENEGFVSTNGLTGPAVGFTFMPPIKALATSPNDPVTWRIRARVTLKAEGAGSVTKDFIVPIQLSVLEIPILLALFRHRDYEPYSDPDAPGFVLMVVPEDSMLQGLAEPFNELMVKLEDAVQPLRAIAGIATFLTNLGVLRQALSVQPTTRLKRGAINNLANVHMRLETFLFVDRLNYDQRAHDCISSLILMGPCGTRVGCYDDENRSLSDGEWAFNVVVGPEMITTVPNLSGAKPPSSYQRIASSYAKWVARASTRT